MTKLASRVGDLADDFLGQLLLAEPDPFDDASRGSHVCGNDRLWGCDFWLVDPIVDELEGGGRYFLFTPDAREPAEIFWPIDFAAAVVKEDHFFLGRASTVTAQDVRGLVKFAPPKMVALTGGWLRPGILGSETTICGLMGKQWVPVENEQVSATTGRRIGIQVRQELASCISVLFAARLSARYDWHAAFGFSDDGPRMVLPTNPVGCLELFRSRDVAPGEKRRAALRHWVNTHYRQRSADDGRIDFVREHLRGHTRFVWNGLEVELMVSEFDLEKNEFFKAQAAEWRAMRKHNRVNLRRKRT